MSGAAQPSATLRAPRRGAARLLSWLLVVSLLAAGVIGLRSLPGARGPVDELRWRLGSPRFFGSAVNDAVRVLWDADAREPGGAARLLAALLVDADPLVTSRALGLLASELNRQTAGGTPPNPALRGAFAAWLRSTPLGEKVGQAELALTCSMHLSVSKVPPDLGDLPISAADHAWMLAGLIDDSLPAQAWASMLVFGASQSPLASLFGSISARVSDRVLNMENRPWTPLTRDELARELRIPLEEIEQLLDSPLPTVRFAAGAVLAFSGDPRGLPATRDWLASRKLSGAPLADKLLTDLFGAGWQNEP